MSTTAKEQELPKQYHHAGPEQRWYRLWEERGYFHSEPDPRRKPYTIVIPPPNVTGALHLGHALNNTIQDILIRSKRMQGYNALYMPGTDHAGIATQAVVERRLLQEEKLSRHDLGAKSSWRGSGIGRMITSGAFSASSSVWAVAATGNGRVLRSTTCAPGRAAHLLYVLSGELDLSRPAAGELGHVPANGCQR